MVYQDGEGDNFHPLESLERVTRVANAPVYSWVDSAMDRGILGGSLKVQTLQAEEVATLALEVLHGANAGGIPVRTPQLYVAQVDWRQLKRWRIPESHVPADTHVLFREPTLWDRYQVYVLGALAILLAQSALIAGLLVQRTRRRQAEEQVRGREVELRSSYERIRDLGARLLNAQESERARIARELHDDISQQMALLQIDLELLGGTAQGDAVAMADDAVNRAQDIARSVHELSHRLHPAKLRLMGLVSALKGLQRELSQSGLTATFTHDPIPATLPAELTLCLFRDRAGSAAERRQAQRNRPGRRATQLRRQRSDAHHRGRRRWLRCERGMAPGARADQHARTARGVRRHAGDSLDAGRRDARRSHGAPSQESRIVARRDGAEPCLVTPAPGRPEVE